MGYHCCRMDDLAWKIIPLATGALGYLGGIATDPLKKLVSDYLKVKELKAGLIGEVANAYHQYTFVLMAGHDPGMLTSAKNSNRVDCFQAAQANPFLLHRIAEYFYLANSLEFAMCIKAKKAPYELVTLLPEIETQVWHIECWLRKQEKSTIKIFCHALGGGAKARVEQLIKAQERPPPPPHLVRPAPIPPPR